MNSSTSFVSVEEFMSEENHVNGGQLTFSGVTSHFSYRWVGLSHNLQLNMKTMLEKV